jgi:drug/metabolite transporter (DMT)-like permease
MLAAVASFVIMAALVKELRGEGLATSEVMFWRVAPGLPWILLELKLRGLPIVPRRPKAVFLRTVFGAMAMTTHFWSIHFLTLIQHTVLHLTQPVFVAVLAPAVLRERLRGWALVALGLALLGALVIVLPGRLILVAAAVAVPLVPALAGIGSAVFSAAAHMAIRQATHGSRDADDPTPLDAPETVVFHFTFHLSVVCLIWTLQGAGFVALTAQGSVILWTKILTMAAFGVAGQLLMSRAYARDTAPTVAVIGYAGIPLSGVLDWIGWGVPPSGTSILGALLMVVAGVLLITKRTPTSV